MKFIGLNAAQQKAVAELLPMLRDRDITVTVKKGDCLTVEKKENNVTLTYEKPVELYYGLTLLDKDFKAKRKYEMLCYMCDCSRNAVPSVEGAKRLIRYLVLMGYDSMMLYTEDTYEVPGYPYFGRMRGRYSSAELKEIDDYAYQFGMEVIPCIQTLAHLATALRWPDIHKLVDIDDILSVGLEETYTFLDAAIGQCEKCFRSRKMNIGMDEAHHLGRGKYLDRNGYRKASDIMTEHLDRVVAICKKHGFKPMMWSDMFFRMCWNGAYYSSDKKVDKAVIEKVNPDVGLVYWDYYTLDKAKVENMLKEHKRFPNDIVFAGGAWKWYGFGAHNHFSIRSSELQLNGCAKHGVNRIIVTAWGDNGGEASQFSSMASCLYFSERCYHKSAGPAQMNRRCKAVFGVSYEQMLGFDLADKLPGIREEKPVNPSKYLLYNDPFERLLDCHLREDTAKSYAENAAKLKKLKRNHPFGYALDTLEKLCSLLSVKADLGVRLHKAYVAGDKDTLAAILKTDIPFVIRGIDALLNAMKKQWYTENKTYGFTTQEIRFGALKNRMLSIKDRLTAYLNGDIAEIEELVEDPLPIDTEGYISFNNWSKTVGAGIV